MEDHIHLQGSKIHWELLKGLKNGIFCYQKRQLHLKDWQIAQCQCREKILHILENLAKAKYTYLLIEILPNITYHFKHKDNLKLNLLALIEVLKTNNVELLSQQFLQRPSRIKVGFGTLLNLLKLKFLLHKT